MRRLRRYMVSGGGGEGQSCELANNGGYDGILTAEQPLKRTASGGSGVVSMGLYLSPGSPSGSDVSEQSSGPFSLPSHVYKPTVRSGTFTPVEVTSSSSAAGDPPTSLSLSLPWADRSETSTFRVTESAQQQTQMIHNMGSNGGYTAGFFLVSREEERPNGLSTVPPLSTSEASTSFAILGSTRL